MREIFHVELQPADILLASGLFGRVTNSARDRLVAMAQLRTFPANQAIVRQDDPCPGVFVIGSGLVKIYKISPAGKEHVLHMAGPRQTFLEVATINQIPCPAFAHAIEDTRCALLPAKPFTQALQQDHQLCLQILGSMAMRVHRFVGLLEDIVLRDALARVAKYLLNAGRQHNAISLQVRKKDLASHLNLTSETLSRCLRQLIDANVIEPGEAQTIRITDRQALSEAAEGVFPRI